MLLQACVAATLWLTSLPTQSGTSLPPIPESVQVLLDDAEYARARKQIDRLLRDRRVAAETRVSLYSARATCDVSLGDEAAAEQSFQKLLTLQPTYRADPARTSPKVLEVYDVVRARMAELGALDSAYQAEFRPVPDVLSGEEVKLEAAFKGAPSSSIVKLFVRYRRVGEPTFESAELTKQADQPVFKGEIPAPFLQLRSDEDQFGVDYYFEAEGADGERLTGIGTQVLPLQFTVSRKESATSSSEPSAGGEQARKIAAVVVPIALGVTTALVVAVITGAVITLTALEPGATHLGLTPLCSREPTPGFCQP